MNESRHLSTRDLEDLSAFLDGELSPNRAARLEERVKSEPALQEALEGLRRTVKLVKSIPEVPTPRDFTLTPAMAGVRESRRPYPLLRLATVLATLAFVSLVGVDALFSFAGAPMAALAPEPGAEREADLAYQLEVERAEEALPAAAVQETPEQMEKIMAAPEEPSSAAELGTPEGEGVLGDDIRAGGGIPETPCEGCLDAMGTAVPAPAEAVAPHTETPTVAPTLTPEPTVVSAAPVVPRRLSGLRVAEISLGAVALTLGALTLWSRRRAG